MAKTEEIRVPDIGDFDEVDVIDVLVKAGDRVAVEGGLITLESEKASMDVPSPKAGTVKQVKVEAGGKVKQGDVIVVLEVAEEEGGEEEPAEEERTQKREKKKEAATEENEEDEKEAGSKRAEEKPRREVGRKPASVRAEEREEGERKENGPEERRGGKAEETSRRPAEPERAPARDREAADLHAEVLVLGSGPGGYTAAFRAADLGQKVVLVERYPTLGGVCLNVGCIPSKALLHAAKVIDEAAEMGERGVRFGEPEIDLDALRAWKDSVVGKLTGGLSALAKRRGVTVVRGTGTFASPHTLRVEDGDGGGKTVSFDSAIVAAGSRVVELPGIPWDDPRVLDSTRALELREVPKRLLVVGGGIIGLELAGVFSALGSEVTVVELLDRLMAGADADLVKPLRKRLEARYAAIHLETKVAKVETGKKGLKVAFEHASGASARKGAPPKPETFDAVLVAVGRRPNGDRIGAEAAGIEVDERGFLRVDERQRTSLAHIYAIGDVVGAPLLAHKASHQGKVAAEVAAGERSAFDARAVPSVAYTDPEVAWVGLTEEEAKVRGVAYGKGTFPWSASGRSLGLGRDEGMTKLLFDEATGRLLGAGLVGPNAGDLIAEAALALEMGAVAADIGLTVHPHPTLSETVAFAADAFEGTLTELYKPKRN